MVYNIKFHFDNIIPINNKRKHKQKSLKSLILNLHQSTIENTIILFDNKVPFHDIQFQNLTPILIT